MGCQIFFVLSAFTLCFSFSQRNYNYFEFIKHRISKLYIGYYFMIFIYLLIRIFIYIFSRNGLLVDAINPFGIIINLLFLHGLYPYGIVNNRIVYGGWFVGTIVIFYYLFPIIYKYIFKMNAKNRLRKSILFLILFEIIFDVIIWEIGLINHRFLCSNNSFMYFSFINQFSSFLLGFILYILFDVNLINKIKYCFIKFLFFLFISIFLFYYNYDFSFIFLPFIFSLSFLYLYCFSTKYIDNDNYSKVKTILCNIGKRSWTIYLIHPILVYFIFKYIDKILSKIIYFDLLRFIILLPMLCLSIYFGSNIFDIILNKISLKKRS